MTQLIERKIKVINNKGLHARTSALLVSCANQFESEVTLIKQSQSANGKNIMSILMLAAGKGTELNIQVEGQDAQEALKAICKLFEDGFGETE